ncbi:Clp protease N-terminal domain-containing protein [Stieleria varia]|uniref:Clp protease N-terminal domain-containing protein n=1 Tax=Stieleria varia TaxID=2528005 RepID=UPI0018D24F1D|nr:Clp protease N-terminal domain-containing protein [Stieleria varia]
METIRQSLDYVAAHKHDYVGIEHILLVLTAPDTDIAVAKHSDLAVSCARVRELVNKQITSGNGDGSTNVPQTPQAKQLLVNSIHIAKALGHLGVNPEHMFLAFLDLESEPMVQLISDDAMVDVNTMRRQLTSASELDKYTLPFPPGIDW